MRLHFARACVSQEKSVTIGTTAPATFAPTLEEYHVALESRLKRVERRASSVFEVVMLNSATSRVQGEDTTTTALCNSGEKTNHIRARE